MQLCRIASDHQRPRGNTELHRNAGRQRRAGQAVSLGNDLLQQQRPGAADSGPAEGQDARHQLARAVRGHDDVIKVTPLQPPRHGVLQRQLAVAQHGTEHVVEIVSNAAGKRAESLELLGLVLLRRDALVALQLAQKCNQQHCRERRDHKRASHVLPGLARATRRECRAPRAPTATTAG